MNTTSNDFIVSHYSKHLSDYLISSYKPHRVDVIRLFTEKTRVWHIWEVERAWQPKLWKSKEALG